MSKLRRSLTLAALCSLAFVLSCAYVRFYLRGGPRIIDATSYFLEARSLAAGSFSFSVPEPSAAFRGRFLLPSSDGLRLGVIFPPGYPLVLSLGMRLGAPLLVGPTLAALLVAATYGLARALGQTSKVALLAAALSAVCAALRYHTADTMSHGLATVLGIAALALARRGGTVAPLSSGLCLGLLLATRPVSAVASGVLVLLSLSRAPRAWALLAAGMLPGALLLLAQQRALTGNWLGSTQLAYYLASDAPAGCFRYGFGAGVGCRYEHGDYVSRFIPNGFGAWHALRSSFVRLALFATDATNAAPLTLLGGYALLRQRSTPLALCGAAIGLQALVYVPFYFDGNYPGGGARFLCEAIPFAQILVARAACDLRVSWLAPLAAVGGFALYARHGHEQLREREGGRPLFEPEVVASAGVKHGLLFVDTDHGFNLGHDPAQNAFSGLLVARLRRDAHDRQLYEELGRPETFRYVYDFKGRAPRVERYVPALSTRFEAEAEWPASPTSGSAYPLHHPCASRSRALRLLPGTRVALPVTWPNAQRGKLTVGWAAKTQQGGQLRFRWSGQTDVEVASFKGDCGSFEIAGPRPEGQSPLLVELVSGEGALDFLDVAGRALLGGSDVAEGSGAR